MSKIRKAQEIIRAGQFVGGHFRAGGRKVYRRRFATVCGWLQSIEIVERGQAMEVVCEPMEGHEEHPLFQEFHKAERRLFDASA